MQVSGAISDVLVVLPPSTPLRLPKCRHLHAFAVSEPKTLLSGRFLKSCRSSCNPKHYNGLYNFLARSLVTRASTDSSDNLVPIAPLQFESPVGQLLALILRTHPHLLPAAIDKQLENLETHRDAQKEESSDPYDPLYKRIAEVKEKEKRISLEEIIYCSIVEIIYCSIVHKFLENNISMIQQIPATSDPTGREDFWPNQVQKLEAIHSPEAFDMIKRHLSQVLSECRVGPLETIIQISKMELAEFYNTSIVDGYIVKRVDERFQLERTMGTLPQDFDKADVSFGRPSVPDSLMRIPAYDESDNDEDYMDNDEGQSFRLRHYMMSLDEDIFQRYTTVRSEEATSLIDKQTQALFGRPGIRISEDGSIETFNDEVLSITISGLTMLVLEAFAFGSFLWDAENYADSKYPFIND